MTTYPKTSIISRYSKSVSKRFESDKGRVRKKKTKTKKKKNQDRTDQNAKYVASLEDILNMVSSRSSFSFQKAVGPAGPWMS
jgi:hypothetical protein